MGDSKDRAADFEHIDFRHWVSWNERPGKDGKPLDPLIKPERQAKGDIQTFENEKRGGKETRSFAFPLDAYRNHKHITSKQYRAGKKFQNIYRKACASGHVQNQYEETSGGRRMEFTPPAFSAVEYHEARGAIRGETARLTAERVCCQGRKAGKHGQMAHLKQALDDLAEHFEFD